MQMSFGHELTRANPAISTTSLLGYPNNSKVAPLVDDLKGETKRKRALQLHHDLLYVRVLLNTPKNVDLIEQYDPKVNELCRKYELMLDSVEYYVISSALHDNVLALSQSTIRLYGLLIPHLN